MIEAAAGAAGGAPAAALRRSLERTRAETLGGGCLGGVPPEAVEREQRGWLRGLIARFRDPAALLPETGDDTP